MCVCQGFSILFPPPLPSSCLSSLSLSLSPVSVGSTFKTHPETHHFLPHLLLPPGPATIISLTSSLVPSLLFQPLLTEPKGILLKSTLILPLFSCPPHGSQFIWDNSQSPHSGPQSLCSLSPVISKTSPSTMLPWSICSRCTGSWLFLPSAGTSLPQDFCTCFPQPGMPVPQILT